MEIWNRDSSDETGNIRPKTSKSIYLHMDMKIFYDLSSVSVLI